MKRIPSGDYFRQGQIGIQAISFGIQCLLQATLINALSICINRIAACFQIEILTHKIGGVHGLR